MKSHYDINVRKINVEEILWKVRSQVISSFLKILSYQMSNT